MQSKISAERDQSCNRHSERARERVVEKATTEKGGHMKGCRDTERPDGTAHNTTDAARAVSSQFNHLNRRVSLLETDEGLIGPVCICLRACVHTCVHV